MKAITIWPEWAAAIVHLGKDVENRGYIPWIIGERFAIHAGRHIGGRPGRVARDEGLEAVCGMYPGVLDWYADQELDLVWFEDPDPARPIVAPIETSAIVATALLRTVATCSSPWAVEGAWHWQLADVRRVVEPVPCVGHQGLWNVPDDVLRDVLAREVVL